MAAGMSAGLDSLGRESAAGGGVVDSGGGVVGSGGGAEAPVVEAAERLGSGDVSDNVNGGAQAGEGWGFSGERGSWSVASTAHLTFLFTRGTVLQLLAMLLAWVRVNLGESAGASHGAGVGPRGWGSGAGFGVV